MDPVSVLLASLFLAWLFLTAGWHKVRRPQHYAAVIAAYELPLLRGNALLALSIGSAELILAVALLIGVTRPVAALAAAVVLTAYAAAIGFNLWRGKRDIDCGCSGPADRQPLSGWLLLRNGVLVLVSLCAAATVSPRVVGWLDWLVILMGSLLAVLLYQVCERLLTNSRLLVNLRS